MMNIFLLHSQVLKNPVPYFGLRHEYNKRFIILLLLNANNQTAVLVWLAMRVSVQNAEIS